MLATASYTLPDTLIGLWPEYWIVNRLEVADKSKEHIFIHKRVEYSGYLRLLTEDTALVRICIVQPRSGGELQFANRATNMSVFGTENPTVATPIREGWIGISDRHYLIGPATRQIELSYEHRLSHNMSLHMNALDRWTHIAEGPMWWFAISDIHNVVQHHNITLRTVGTVKTVILDDE